MPATANTTALILLRIGFALAATLATLLLLTHCGSNLPFGTASLYTVALTGGAFILSGLRSLIRDTAGPVQPAGKDRAMPRPRALSR